MRKCQSFLRGNLIAWNKQNLNLKNKGDNLKIENIADLSQFCNRRQYLLVPKFVDLHTAYDQCKTFGGHIATPTNTEENEEVLRLVKTFPVCLSKYLFIINYKVIVSLSVQTTITPSPGLVWRDWLAERCGPWWTAPAPTPTTSGRQTSPT